MFGALISATDPVAVVALLKDVGASKRLGTIIEGESLLNDGSAFVLFLIFKVPSRSPAIALGNRQKKKFGKQRC
jgi:NhaP-type Na+/H+ and K+/H+ antiporter